MHLRSLAFAGIAISLFGVPALGHHSFAKFDHGQTLSLNGTVTEFEWLNPHCWLHLKVVDEDRNSATWYFERADYRLSSQRPVGWLTQLKLAIRLPSVSIRPKMELTVASSGQSFSRTGPNCAAAQLAGKA